MSNPESLAESGYLFTRIVDEIRRTALTTVELADLTGVKERQVLHWAAGTSRPSGTNRDRLLDVHYIVQELVSVYKPEGVEIWLHGRNRDLGGERPIDLLRAGEFRTVIDAV